MLLSGMQDFMRVERESTEYYPWTGPSLTVQFEENAQKVQKFFERIVVRLLS